MNNIKPSTRPTSEKKIEKAAGPRKKKAGRKKGPGEVICVGFHATAIGPPSRTVWVTGGALLNANRTRRVGE